MELKVVLYLLIFLNGYSQGENAESTAVRNQHKPEAINKVIPQKVYAVPNGIPNANPTLNVRLNNGVKNVPRIVVPVVTQHPSVKVLTPTEPKKADSNTASTQTISKDEKAKENKSEIKDAKFKGPQFFEDVEQDIKTGSKTIPKDNKPQASSNDQKNKETSKKTESNQLINNEKKSGQENISKGTPASKDMKIVPPDASKIEILPKTEIKTSENDKQDNNGAQSNDSLEVDAKSSRTADGSKDSFTYSIYKLHDDDNKYSRAFYNQPNVYTDNIDCLNNQQTSNVIIKNHDIEEMCERGQDIISPYQPDPYNDQYNLQQPDVYQSYSNYYPQNTPVDYGLPSYQCQSEGTYNTNSGMEWPSNPKDRVWRNWKSTEIYISKYDPIENKFNNGYFRSNGFGTPFINGGVIGSDYRNPNTPFFYQCYLHPMYKYMY